MSDTTDDPITTPATNEIPAMTDPNTIPDDSPEPDPRPAPPGPGSALRRFAPQSQYSRPLAPVRLGANAALVVPFTTDDQEIDLHYLEDVDFKGHVRCPGAGCLLCQIGRGREKRYLLPVYNPAVGGVDVLPIPPSQRAGALGPALHPLLERVAAGERLTVEIRKTGLYTYAVTALPPAPGATSGAAEIGRFMADAEAGKVKLENAFPLRSRAELLYIPEVARVATARRITE